MIPGVTFTGPKNGAVIRKNNVTKTKKIEVTQLPIKAHLGSDSESSDDEGDAAMAHSGESGELKRELVLSEKSLTPGSRNTSKNLDVP